MNKQSNEYKVLGLMSGTSLDGLDICLCQFKFEKNKSWEFEVLAAETIKYTKSWSERLKTAHLLDAKDLIDLHAKYGSFLGLTSKEFLRKRGQTADLLSSHGHTVFHQPDSGYTFQLGNGANIAANCGILSICDFRTTDIAKGGQGAPLVPFGDLLLFPAFDACLNIGGFSNICIKAKELISYDICPANLVMNYLAESKGLPYDKDGQIAKAGTVIKELLAKLNSLEYYHKLGPKSLGREWVEKEIFPLLKKTELSVEDQMRTFIAHIVFQIGSSLKKHTAVNQVLISGGGTNNKFLLRELQKLPIDFTVPNQELVEFKEAIIFAFLGLKRFKNEINCLGAVTGSKSDSIAGSIYHP